ncbi:hypothetical protein [Massilia sp. TWR1-2-2]|uniref:hypothetical protein n=1 Tax=Massilia sp. TWR1-2-2 TaxID=2804584 RepID=UPI003CF42593
MQTSDQQRYEMIERALRRQSDYPGGANLMLWERLAAELSVIIGAGGFDALYFRSLHLARESYPWIMRGPEHVAGEAFRPVALSLNGHDPTEANAANAALLGIFTRTLTILIGELLLNNILRKAWGDDALYLARTEHES